MKKQMAFTFVALLSLSGPAAAKDLRSDLMANEKLMWTAWGKKDPAPFRKLLTPDAVEIIAGTEPTTGREAIANAIVAHSCELRSFSHNNSSLRMLSPTVALLSYSAAQDTSCQGAVLPPKLRVTVVYVHQGKIWRIANYQETPVN